MKKYLSLLLVFLLPFIIGAAECNADKVAITSINLLEKTGAEEKAAPTFEKLTTNVDVAFKNPGDSIKYKIEITNESKDIFKITNDAVNKSDIIEYTYEIEGDALYIKPGEVKSVNLLVTYKNEVPSTSFVNNVYTENYSFPIKISTNETLPKTGITKLLELKYLLPLLILLSILIYVIFKKRSIKYLALLVITIPFITYALCEASFVSNIKVEIKKENPKFCFVRDFFSYSDLSDLYGIKVPVREFAEFQEGDTVSKIYGLYGISTWEKIDFRYSQRQYDTDYKNRAEYFLFEVELETGLKFDIIEEFEQYFLHDEKYSGAYDYINRYKYYGLHFLYSPPPDLLQIDTRPEAKIISKDIGCYIILPSPV